MLLDIEMGAMNGFSVARWVKKHMPGVKIVFLTMHAEPVYVGEAVAIGANGYVVKRNAVAELMETVRTVIAGRTYFPVPRPPCGDCAEGNLGISRAVNNPNLLNLELQRKIEPHKIRR